MTIFCLLRAFVFNSCWCSYCQYSRRLDAMIDDWNREQAASRVSHKDGAYR